jgi:DNA-binding CsgD family transcriptional regulator
VSVSPAAAETLYERAREIARIDGRLAEARGGDGGLIVIEGPAGIGKTRLLHELRAHAERTGMTVLAGRGSELERGFAFGVLRQALERPLAELDPGAREAVTAGPAAHALPLFDPARSVASIEAPLHGVFWLLANLAERQAVVLAVDDAHWADESSLLALGYLARRIEQLPVALVISTRPPGPDAFRSLAALVSDAAAERLTPAPLGEEAVAALSASDEPEFVHAAIRATGGKPFLLHELLRELGDDRDAAAVARVEPRELGRLMLARVSDRARAFASALVVLGDRATSAECRALAELDGTAEAIDELVAAGVLTEDADPGFRHPLIAAAVSAELSPARRAAWHRRAAELLRGSGADVERVAVHLAACPPAADDRVAELLFDAAMRALARGAPTSARPFLRRALDEPPEASRRPRMLLALAEVETMAGVPDAVSHFTEAARTSRDPYVRIRALEANGWWWGLRPDSVEDDLAQIDALIGALPPDAGDLRIRAEVVRLAVACRSTTAMTDAVARAERLGLFDDAAPKHPDLFAHVALWGMVSGHRAEDCVPYALRAAAAASDAHRVVPPSLWFPITITVLKAGERLDEARAVARSMQQAMREHGSPTWYGLTTHSHARLLRDSGDLPEAEAEAQIAVAAVAASEGWMSALPTATLAAVLLDRGRRAEADHAWSRLGLGPEVPDVRPLIELLIVRARLRHATGDLAGALHDLAEATRRLSAFGPASMNDQPARLHRALLQHAGGDREAAAATAAEGIAVAEHWGTPGAIGEALRVQGVITSDVEALRDAVSHLAASPLRLEHATALADLGGLLRRGAARRDAREPLRAALDLARDCGADGLAERAAGELEATGARVPPRTGSGRDALTPSERRIAQMAADGATNKEIAHALFLSVKTIEMHLSHSYRKLDIGSRRELPAAMTEQR